MQQLQEKDGAFDEAIEEIERLTNQIEQLEKKSADSALEVTQM